ncbi:MAG: hypothetical protein AABW84_02495 [Nanoarchaeota archaeon]|mgnify:CR=1 FL=1
MSKLKSTKAKSYSSIKDLDQSWIDYFVGKFNGDKVVRNIFELDFLAARIVRVDGMNILPATIYAASVYSGSHPVDAIADLREFLECSEESAYKNLEASQKIRLYCFDQLARKARI